MWREKLFSWLVSSSLSGGELRRRLVVEKKGTERERTTCESTLFLIYVMTGFVMWMHVNKNHSQNGQGSHFTPVLNLEEMAYLGFTSRDMN